MKDTIILTLRGIIFGGAFGAKLGALIGFYSQETWAWIAALMITGVVVGLGFCALIIVSKRQTEKSTKAEHISPVPDKNFVLAER